MTPHPTIEERNVRKREVEESIGETEINLLIDLGVKEIDTRIKEDQKRGKEEEMNHLIVLILLQKIMN